MRRPVLVLLPFLGFSLACTGILGGDTADTAGGDAPDRCVWYRDQDGDGFGDPDRKEAGCDQPSGYVANDEDCDDEDPGANPDGTEVCDDADADEDCDGDTDEDDESVELSRWYADSDGDGYGDPEAEERACDAPEGHVANDRDCDDTDRKINPDGQEICDGEGGDEDCDGLLDSDDDSMASSPLPTWYSDDDGDGYGDPDGTTKKQCDEPSGGWAANDDDCDDGDRNINPGETETCGNDVDDNCNGSADGCGMSGDISLGSADLKITGTSGYGVGGAVCGGGDIDGDGKDDVVIRGSHTSGVGGAYAVYGGASGTITLSSGYDVKFSGESAGDLFGAACAIGDLTGDGDADVVIGDPYYDYSSSYSNTGRVYLFSSPLSATETSANTIYTNNSGSSDYAGTALAIGDWSGDGRNDLFIGTYGPDTVFADYGTISSSSGKDLFGINEFEGSLDYSGQVASGGDVDGDGSDDLVAGYTLQSSSERGYIYLFTGEFGGTGLTLSSRADALLTGDLASSGVIGLSMDIRSDLNDDGYADLLAGDYTGDGMSNNSGRAHVCFGPWSSGAITGCDVQYNGAEGYFGMAVASMDDEDGNAVPEVLIGAPEATGDASKSGVVYLFHGPVSAGTVTASAADATFNGTAANAYTGATLANAGDFDGDGIGDFIVGAYNTNSGAGAAFIIFGGGL